MIDVGARLVLLAAAVVIGACGERRPPDRGTEQVGDVTIASAAAPLPQRANPASRACVDAGATVQVEKRPGGGEYGVCTFTANRQCEEWALLRGRCPSGGVQITDYVTPAGRYCAITGGTYAITAANGTVEERGSCTLPGPTVCGADEYFAGACPRSR